MGIYIYNVKDADLKGVTQVTAAHEDLHAIYGRLSSKDRTYVNGLLQDYYDHGLQSQHVKSEIDLYKKTEPNDVLDEMHSTFGTEVADLSAPLEAYYKQYFTNRAAIVAYEQHYEQAFSARQQVVMADDQQLTTMKSQIDARQAQLNSQQAQIKAVKSRLDSLLAAGQSNTYNNEVDGYNARVNTYNTGVASLRSFIQSYNNVVAARNTVADQINALNRAQDTRLSQQKTL
jgi:chromosome segregation ATPase